MRSSSPTSMPVDVRPGKPPMLRADANSDAERWAAEHRDALRTLVAEHGSLLVRGLGLRTGNPLPVGNHAQEHDERRRQNRRRDHHLDEREAVFTAAHRTLRVTIVVR